MLLKTTTDYQDYLRTAKHLEFAVLQPHFEALQADLIVNIFGLDFISNLDTRYNTSSPSPALSTEENYLIKLLQKAIASLGFVNAIPSLLITIQGTGLQQAGAKPIYEWQKLAIQDQILETGWNAIGAAIKYCWAKRADSKFALWKDSAEEKISRQFFINSANEFNNSFQIARSTRTYEALKASLKEAHQTIKSVLGDALYAEIKTQNVSFTISDNNKVLLDNYINDALAQLTIAIAVFKIELVFNEEGARVVSQPASKSTQRAKTQATEQTKINLSAECSISGNNYLSELTQYLKINAETYPLYVPILNDSTANATGGCCVL